MSEEKPYKRFIEHMQNWVLGLPDSEELIPILELRLSPEEAEFLADMPFLPHSIEQLAELFGETVEELSAKLDPLAKRGVVFRHQSEHTVRYALNDSLFAFLRSPLWAGKRDETTKKLAPLANRYYLKAYAKEFSGYETQGLRAIPIEGTVDDTRQIVPYEDVVKVLENEEVFCTATCPCRHRKNLDPDSPSCEHETGNCLHFGRLAKYMIKNKMGKQITRDEMMEILKAAADEGLIHGISNSKHGMDTICNCCSCCCLFTESKKKLGLHGHQPSNYILSINPDTCEACGLCVDRCPMDALDMGEESPELTEDLCIGCGVCAHKCPSESLKLVHRDGEQDFPEDFREMGMRMGMERGRNPFK
jgi:formate hydrogenlyase subunit 6/NADH:ubiquinone oxidoreductase subunit I